MSDFEFLKNPVTGKLVISAPRRSHRIDDAKQKVVCPFCPGQEAEDEVYRIPVISSQFSVVGSQSTGLSVSQTDIPITDKPETENRKQRTDNRISDWSVRVIANKFPFTPHHEVIIHSPNHYANFDRMPQTQAELVLQTYKQRYITQAQEGQVYIFQNHGHAAGESLHHPHSQLVVVPFDIQLDIPPLSQDNTDEKLETEQFFIFCPTASEWPDEVWLAPKRQQTVFGDITDEEIKDLAFVLSRIIQIFDTRHGKEFPFNFYIYPGKNWYLRLIPRIKILGGFEIGTGVMVNTQEPAKTMEFMKEHFEEPNHEKIKSEHQADYRKKV